MLSASTEDLGSNRGHCGMLSAYCAFGRSTEKLVRASDQPRITFGPPQKPLRACYQPRITFGPEKKAPAGMLSA